MRRLSLVVITRNRRELLAQSLAQHLKSLPADTRPGDLIVVDNASADGTSAWLASTHPEITCLTLAANVGPAARNVGVALASTRYVAFSDDDSWWEPGALDRACDILDADPTTGLVAGAAWVGIDETPDPLNQVLADSPLRRGRGEGVPVLGFMAFAAVVRRDAFLGSGGFPVGLGIGGEEQWLALGLATDGWDLRYLPDVIARHRPEMIDDRVGRGPDQERHALAIALARRRGRPAMRAVVSSLGGTDLRQLVASVRWGLTHRQPLPPRVEHDVRRVEAAGRPSSDPSGPP